MLKTIVQTLVTIIILGILIYVYQNNTNKFIKDLQEQNKRLELKLDTLDRKNDSLKIHIEKYEIKIDSLKNEDAKLEKEYDENKKQLKNIKDKYEKNNRIDNFSTPDIIKYFTDSI